MAKKQILKRGIPTDLVPVKDETWLIQPLVVTTMRHDFSKTQIKVLVSIIERLQIKIHEKLNDPAKELFKSEDFDEDGKVPVQLFYKDLGVSDSNYGALEESLKMLSHIPVEIPTRGKDKNKVWLKSTNLCDVYTQDNVKYNKYAVIKMDQDVAERLISLEFGYHKLGKEVIFNAKNKYSQRIYMLLESWLDRGWFQVDTLEFRKSLRLEKKYDSFYDFEKRVLKPAGRELEEAAKAGYCDCYFDYRPEYAPGQKKSEYPPTLYFTVHKVKTEMDKQFEEITEGYRRQFTELLMTHFKLVKANAEKLASYITYTNYNGAIKKMTELYNYMQEHSGEINDRLSYVHTSFMNYFGQSKEEK